MHGKSFFHFFFQPCCITMYKYITKKPRPEHVAEWFPNDRKWPRDDLNKDKKLRVFFMNECHKNWKYKNRKISGNVIMELLQVSWEDCFVIVNRIGRDPHVRVQFQGNLQCNLQCNLPCSYSLTLVFTQINPVVTGQLLAVRLSSLVQKNQLWFLTLAK